MAWVLLVGQVVVIGICLVAIRSFGKWTKQLLHTNRSNELILKELRVINRPIFRGETFNHVANFVDESPDQEIA